MDERRNKEERRTNKMKKKILIALIAVCTVLFAFGMVNASAAEIVDSGTCGDNLTWTLDDSGTLTISGSGMMNSYDSYPSYSPWYSYRSSIKQVVIGDSVASIGKYAFFNLDNLTNVTIGDSVTSINDCAFNDCDNLADINFPDSVTTIGSFVSMNCDSLKSVTIGANMTNIGYQMFDGCVSLISITIPNSVTKIEYNAFGYSPNLTTVNYNGTVASWNKITIQDGNTDLTDATRNYFWYVTYIDENGDVIQKDMITPNATASLPEISVEEGCEAKFYLDEAYTTEFAITTPITENTTLYVKISEKQFVPYTINSITIKNTSGNEFAEIPVGTFLATVSITNNCSDSDNMVVLASYSASGAFSGLMYISVEDMPIGSTFKLSIPVDNSKGDVAKLKAFCWESFNALTPLGKSVSYPAE